MDSWIMSSKRVTIVLGLLVIGIFGFIAYRDAVGTWQNLQEQERQLQNLNVEHQELNKQLDSTIESKEQSQEEIQKLEQEKQNLEQERQRLEKELQAKAEAKAKLAEASKRVINTATATQVARAQGACGDNDYAAYIYGMESGGRVPGNCSTTATNAGGCYGIGQDCNGVLRSSCGADYACQNAYFNDYAIRRYKSWANAYAFHKANGWW